MHFRGSGQKIPDPPDEGELRAAGELRFESEGSQYLYPQLQQGQEVYFYLTDLGENEIEFTLEKTQRVSQIQLKDASISQLEMLWMPPLNSSGSYGPGSAGSYWDSDLEIVKRLLVSAAYEDGSAWTPAKARHYYNSTSTLAGLSGTDPMETPISFLFVNEEGKPALLEDNYSFGNRKIPNGTYHIQAKYSWQDPADGSYKETLSNIVTLTVSDFPENVTDLPVGQDADMDVPARDFSCYRLDLLAGVRYRIGQHDFEDLIGGTAPYLGLYLYRDQEGGSGSAVWNKQVSATDAAGAKEVSDYFTVDESGSYILMVMNTGRDEVRGKLILDPAEVVSDIRLDASGVSGVLDSGSRYFLQTYQGCLSAEVTTNKGRKVTLAGEDAWRRYYGRTTVEIDGQEVSAAYASEGDITVGVYARDAETGQVLRNFDWTNVPVGKDVTLQSFAYIGNELREFGNCQTSAPQMDAAASVTEGQRVHLDAPDGRWMVFTASENEEYMWSFISAGGANASVWQLEPYGGYGLRMTGSDTASLREGRHSYINLSLKAGDVRCIYVRGNRGNGIDVSVQRKQRIGQIRLRDAAVSHLELEMGKAGAEMSGSRTEAGAGATETYPANVLAARLLVASAALEDGTAWLPVYERGALTSWITAEEYDNVVLKGFIIAGEKNILAEFHFVDENGSPRGVLMAVGADSVNDLPAGEYYVQATYPQKDAESGEITEGKSNIARLTITEEPAGAVKMAAEGEGSGDGSGASGSGARAVSTAGFELEPGQTGYFSMQVGQTGGYAISVQTAAAEDLFTSALYSCGDGGDWTLRHADDTVWIGAGGNVYHTRTDGAASAPAWLLSKDQLHVFVITNNSKAAISGSVRYVAAPGIQVKQGSADGGNGSGGSEAGSGGSETGSGGTGADSASGGTGADSGSGGTTSGQTPAANSGAGGSSANATEAPADSFARTEQITIRKKPAGVKAKAAGSKTIITWKAIKKTKKTRTLLKQIRKVEVQYATDRAFSQNLRTKKVGGKKTKATLRLAKGSTWYIRVRYTDGKGGVSRWSRIRTVK